MAYKYGNTGFFDFRNLNREQELNLINLILTIKLRFIYDEAIALL